MWSFILAAASGFVTAVSIADAKITSDLSYE
jgi:hypothetical protein